MISIGLKDFYWTPMYPSVTFHVALKGESGSGNTICWQRASRAHEWHRGRAAHQRSRCSYPAVDQPLWQWEETATDCIVPSPSFLSREPHLSTPGGMALLEERVSGSAGDKRLEMRRGMRAPQINVSSQSRESGIKEENVDGSVMESGCCVSRRVCLCIACGNNDKVVNLTGKAGTQLSICKLFILCQVWFNDPEATGAFGASVEDSSSTQRDWEIFFCVRVCVCAFCKCWSSHEGPGGHCRKTKTCHWCINNKITTHSWRRTVPSQWFPQLPTTLPSNTLKLLCC